MCAAAGTALAKNTLLGTLEDQEMTTLVEFAFPYQAEAGATIIQQGDVGDYFYIIKNGKVEYVKDGKKEPFQGGKTDSFGELALLHDDKRAATVVARTDCDLFRISRDSFRYAIANAQNQESASYLDSLRKVKLFENPNGIVNDNDVDYPIRLILSSFWWQNSTKGIPDGLSDCSLCTTNCDACVSTEKWGAFDDSSTGYDDEYTRPHRDADVVAAMQSWMGL